MLNPKNPPSTKGKPKKMAENRQSRNVEAILEPKRIMILDEKYGDTTNFEMGTRHCWRLYGEDD